MSKLKLNTSYHFHYIKKDNFTYKCLANGLLSKATVFAFLEEIEELICYKFSENIRR